MYIDDSLKREFYIEIAKLEGWSVRKLQERINSILFERTALSRKPEETIRGDLAELRQTQQSSPSSTYFAPVKFKFYFENSTTPSNLNAEIPTMKI
jgi:predicted nuclease of restriction endonuclease-like (RecB) superfamily